VFAATLLGGWLLYRFVETPMMRRFSRARTPRLVTRRVGN
jgi:peptidoglycan/LPS O-acetylase OafA/YrhL